MQDKTNPAPVDVLAELDRRIEIEAMFGPARGHDGQQPGTDALREARAAVAELVEAAKALADSQSPLWERGNAYISANGAKEMNDARDKMRAALAKFGGAK